MTEDDEILVDESPPEQPRFDAVPVILETRGVTRQKPQMLLWSAATVHKNSVAAKLRAVGRPNEALKLEKCHTIYTVAVCNNCSKVQKFPNRCDLFYCPECQPRLSSDRRKAVEWWTKEIKQPKHVVLTVKNTRDLTKGHVQQFRDWFTKLRRRKFAQYWRGGFYRMEVTNEGRGWHLHMHCLVDASWIDKQQLSIEWNEVNNGMGRIVEVYDAWQSDYLKEVTKYAVKGNQLAAWDGKTIAEFIDAFKGVRTFGVFGSLYGARTRFAEWWKFVRSEKPRCECGCCDARYYTESEFLALDLVPAPNTQALPPPAPKLHPEFKMNFGQPKLTFPL